MGKEKCSQLLRLKVNEEEMLRLQRQNRCPPTFMYARDRAAEVSSVFVRCVHYHDLKMSIAITFKAGTGRKSTFNGNIFV